MTESFVIPPHPTLSRRERGKCGVAAYSRVLGNRNVLHPYGRLSTMARMANLLGIDIGTSGTKTLICDRKGKVLATAMAEHSIASPRPGWSEQDPLEWWSATCKATKAVLKKAKLKGADITGIGLSGQMHGSVFLGAGEKPLRPALLWNDQRTADQCFEIESKAGGREALIELVANPALTGFTAPKILWVRQHEPRVYEKTKHILKDLYAMLQENNQVRVDDCGTMCLAVVLLIGQWAID